MIERCPITSEFCPYYDKKPRRKLAREYGETTGCYSDTDHKYYPEKDYKTPLEKEFRELPQNKEQLCRWEHDERHEFEHPPRKPSIGEMVAALTTEIEYGTV